MKPGLFLIILYVFLTSCSKDQLSVEDQFKVDTGLIEDYLKQKNLTAEKTIDGIYFIIDKEGSAEKPKVTSTVTVNYSGYFLDGTVFDSAEKAQFQLYNTIQGWQIGIPKFGKTGKGKLVIPSKFAYGTSTGPGRANAILAFDIEVLDFK